VIRSDAEPEDVDVSLRSLLLPGAIAVAVAVLAVTLRNQPAGSTIASTRAVSTQAQHVMVAIRNYDFAPRSLTVRAGTRVTWTNHDATAHTATANPAGFDTGTLAANASHTIDFKHPGTFTYHCAFHAFMTATVTVRRY
jgi:plastocyanin